MKVRFKDIPLNCLLVAVILYSLSKASWGIIVPVGAWRIVLLFSGIIFTLLWFINKPSRDFFLFSLVGLLIVVFLFNNQNLNNPLSQQMCEMAYIAMIGFSLCAYKWKNISWIKTGENLILFMSLFYSVMTILSALSSGFYNSIIYPFISSHYTTNYLKLGAYYSAGFTYNYSMNAMVIAPGVCIAYGKIINAHKHINKIIKEIFVFAIIISALLLTE